MQSTDADSHEEQNQPTKQHSGEDKPNFTDPKVLTNVKLSVGWSAESLLIFLKGYG